MYISLSPSEFDNIKREKEKEYDHYYRIGIQFITDLTANVHDSLTPPQVSILLFIWNRTMNFSRAGSQIYSFQFEKGVTSKDGSERICAPLPMSLSTFYRHVQTLCDDDFINIYTEEGCEKKPETEPRIYEINIGKFIRSANSEEISAVLPVPKRLKTGSETNPKMGGSQSEKGGCQIDTHNIYISNRLPSDTSYPQSVVGRSVPSRRKQTGATSLNIPVDKAKASSAIEVIQQVTAAHRSTREARAAQAKASPATVTRETLQALIDRVREQHIPTAPRMFVTAKDFGMFRKNLKSIAPDDIERFLIHVYVYWSDIARRNAAALKKRGAGKEPISAAPNFKDLAYRYSYFLTIYNNTSATGITDERDDKIAKLEQKARQQQEIITTLRNRVIRRPAPRDGERTAPIAPKRESRPTSRPAASLNATFSDAPLPSWDD